MILGSRFRIAVVFPEPLSPIKPITLDIRISLLISVFFSIHIAVDAVLFDAIIAEDINKIKSIKGIGIKTAQRVIIDLKDKIAKGGEDTTAALFAQETSSAILEEALAALVMLGFAKAAADKAVKAVYKENPNYTLEQLIKFSLKRL